VQAAARSRPLLAGDLHVALLASDGHNAAGRRGSVRAGYADAKRDLEGDAGEATAHRRGPRERTAGRHLRLGLVEPKVCRSSSPNPIAVQNSFFICKESTQYPGSTLSTETIVNDADTQALV